LGLLEVILCDAGVGIFNLNQLKNEVNDDINAYTYCTLSTTTRRYVVSESDHHLE
jgi:hypothetical protein